MLSDFPIEIPTFERLLDRARALTSASANWEPGKSVHGVKTFSLPQAALTGSGKGPRWWARVSQHSGGRTATDASGFDDLWSVLSKDKFLTEKQYDTLAILFGDRQGLVLSAKIHTPIDITRI